MIDNRNFHFDSKNTELINQLCTRHFGIGADGLILLENHPDYDFKMVYFNSDGNESTMCGNGGRCIIQFAHDLKIINNKCSFIAIDGPHLGEVLENTIALQMQNVNAIKVNEERTELDTGSPHYVAFMNELPTDEFVSIARSIRQNETYKAEGINVNFAQTDGNKIKMRTFERGVENETLACGTGATAVAISAHKKGLISNNDIPVSVVGGELSVRFKEENGEYSNVWLTGPAKYVFEGNVTI